MLASSGNIEGGTQGQADSTAGEEVTEERTEGAPILEETGEKTDKGSGEETEHKENGRRSEQVGLVHTRRQLGGTQRWPGYIWSFPHLSQHLPPTNILCQTWP